MKNSISSGIGFARTLRVLFISGILIPALTSGLSAQSFRTYGGLIPNNSTGNCFNLSVSGVGNLTSAHGMVRVCLSIDQARPADMDISLRSPDGTVVILSTDNGGTSGNDYYEGLCFSDCGPSGPITSGSNFRGVYSPEASLSAFNTGASGNGIWQLCIDDDNISGTDGILNYFSLHFGTQTMPISPSGETCGSAFALSLPFEHTCMTLAGSVDNYSACTGMMDGADYIYSYTPLDSGEYLSVDIAQDFYAPSGFPTVLLLDTCPDVAFPANCIQYEIQMNSSENILHITSQPMKQGKTYYIVAASSSGTGGIYDIRIASGKNGSDNCLNATVIDDEAEMAGNNYAALDVNLQAPSTTEMPCNGSIDNFVFYTFTTDALGSAVYVSVTDIDCDLSCGGSCGIQLALFEAPSTPCAGPGNWGSPVYCEASTETNVYYNWTGLKANTQYYLMVDGNAGSHCVWNLQAMGDFQKLLPVEMTGFSVENQGQSNYLTWSTSEELNFSHFEVEHARQLPDFEEVGEVAAAGFSQEKRDYSFGHGVNESGWHYYRLKNVDLDGSFTYSNVQSVFVEWGEDQVNLYPNPARQELYLRYGPGSAAVVSIFTVNGLQVGQFDLEADNSVSEKRIEIGHLENGFYFLRIGRANGQVETHKFLKM